jgi:hypothetical protein
VRLTLNFCYPKKRRVEFKVFYIRSLIALINKYKVLFLSVNLSEDLEQKFLSPVNYLRMEMSHFVGGPVPFGQLS